MQDLFIKEIEDGLVKTGESELNSLELPKDSSKWTEEILKIFLQLFPFLQEQPLSISWRKKNPDTGYGVGYINLFGGGVPLIINESMLSPMDLLILPEGTTLPLHPEMLDSLMSDPTAFAGLQEAKAKSNDSLFNSHLNFSPVTEYGEGNYINVKPAIKIASVLDSINYVHKDDVSELLKSLDSFSKERFEKNGTVSVFSELVTKAKGHTKEAALSDIVRNLEIDRQLVYEDSFGNKFVKQANAAFDKTWDIKLDDFEDENLPELLTNTKVAKKAKDKSFLVKEGTVSSFVLNDKEINFEVIKVAELNAPKVFGAPILGQPNHACYFDEAHNWNILEKQAHISRSFDEVEGSEIKIGDFGAFFLEGQATEPFEVTSMTKSASAGIFSIKGESGFKKYAFYPVKPKADTFEQREDEKNAFWVPGNAKFVKLAKVDNKLKELTDFEASIKLEGLSGLNKIAVYASDTTDKASQLSSYEYLVPKSAIELARDSLFEKVASKHSVYKESTGLYHLKGPQFAKYAENHPVRNLNTVDAQWAVVHCGGTTSDVKKVASLQSNRSVRLDGDIKAPISLQKLDEKLASVLTDSDDIKLDISKNLVKVASFIRDKAVVDAVLSLNLLRKKNVIEYLAVLPLYEKVLSELGKLLLASRLGLENTSPETIKEAIEALTDTILHLTKLKASIKEVR